jgi:mRNA interferase RelE/StbE
LTSVARSRKSRYHWITSELRFRTEALKEWRTLGETASLQFKKKLIAVLEAPELLSARLSGSHTRCKIKLHSSGFRLVYEVRNRELVVVVVAIGKRDRNDAYRKADQRH